MTTTLMYYFMRYVKQWPVWLVIIIICVFVCVEGCFFVANAVKLLKRLFFLVFEFGLIGTMYIFYKASRINARILQFVKLKDQLPYLADLSMDIDIAKFATHLIYLTRSNDATEIEQSIMYSILSRKPKRADFYWFIHINRTDEPYTMDYSVDKMQDDKVARLVFNLGFRVQPRIDILFRNVLEEMVSNKELSITSNYESLKKYNLLADFQFVILDKFLSYNNEFTNSEWFILHGYFRIKKFALTETEAFGLDTSETRIEGLPLVFKPVKVKLNRIDGTTK